ncbi:EcsC protein family [Rubellimicrobium thermophilum DSM 16684]|uniref:EcsC protein family n=1 Tax=Rubellimicrobium thermophilum DSM 16684 TaxID=1123069 RepID=S9QUA7_9RHOB|nr:EcsC protein family [Rubellimicrobium thermophilum DSM 16684]
MRAVNLVGGSVEDGLKRLPGPLRARLDHAAQTALLHCYHAAERSREDGWDRRFGQLGPLAARLKGDRAHKMLAAASGAVGGLGGLPTAVIELPLAVTIIFRAVQEVAAAHGEDPSSAETRAECLRVFGAGGQGAGDDGVNTSFLGARLSLTGPAINRLVARIAPRFAAVFGQKLASGAVPLIGAAAGAGTNWAFIDYYVEMAHVHFGLRRLARRHGEDAVRDEFLRATLALMPPPVGRAGA